MGESKTVSYKVDSYGEIARELDDVRAEAGGRKLIDAGSEAATDHNILTVPSGKVFHMRDVHIVNFAGGAVTVLIGDSATAEATRVDEFYVAATTDAQFTNLAGRIVTGKLCH